MSVEYQSDALPILHDRGFDTTMRGYDRRQVDDYVARLDEDIRALSAERDAAIARSADLAAQLASTQAHIESLRRQLQAAAEPVTAENVEPRIRELLQSAAADAAKLRADADAYAARVRHGADESAQRIRANARAEADEIIAAATARHAEADEAFRSRIAEAELHRNEVLGHLEAQVAATREQEAQLSRDAEIERRTLNEHAAAERARLDAESEERRRLAEEDFEIALRARRTAETQKSAEQLAAAHAEAEGMIRDAEQRLADARAEAERITREAEQRVAELGERHANTHARLQDLHQRLGAIIDEFRP